MSKQLRKATHEGVLKIGNSELDVAVLQDGTRVITQTGVFKALDRPARGNARLINIPVFMDAKNLQPYVNDEVRSLINKIDFLSKSGKTQEGYDANILPVVSELYLKAREDGVLYVSQEDTAKKAEILVRSLAKVAIIALVDEATGYQYERENDELQKVLSAYISKELLPWQKRFPDEFYKEIFRLNGWHYTVSGIGKNNRPGIIGTWTLQLIYNLLPKGVREELERVTPKNDQGTKTAKMHQSLTSDIGNPHLEKQLVSVITLMNVSSNWKEFIKLFQKKFAQTMMDEGISPKKYKITPPELADSAQPDLFTNIKELGTEPTKKQSSGDEDFDLKMNKGLKKGKPPKTE